jgi:hypothetical protein
MKLVTSETSDVIELQITDIEDNPLGTIEVEYYKLRAVLDSFAEFGKVFYPDTQGNNNATRRSTIRVDSKEGEVKVNA